MERPANSKLEDSRESPMLTSMNAVDVIEEIKRLPEKERSKVVEFVRHLPNAETVEAINEPIEDWPRFDSVEELFREAG